MDHVPDSYLGGEEAYEKQGWEKLNCDLVTAKALADPNRGLGVGIYPPCNQCSQLEDI